MSDDTLLTRREFTVESALAMLAGVTITITGCGDDEPNRPPIRHHRQPIRPGRSAQTPVIPILAR